MLEHYTQRRLCTNKCCSCKVKLSFLQFVRIGFSRTSGGHWACQLALESPMPGLRVALCRFGVASGGHWARQLALESFLPRLQGGSVQIRRGIRETLGPPIGLRITDARAKEWSCADSAWHQGDTGPANWPRITDWARQLALESLMPRLKTGLVQFRRGIRGTLGPPIGPGITDARAKEWPCADSAWHQRDTGRANWLQNPFCQGYRAALCRFGVASGGHWASNWL